MTLRVESVSAGYAGAEVIHSVDLSLEAGERLALLGPNGAGKSTLVNVISGSLPASQGEVLLDGKSMRRTSRQKYAAAGIRWVGDPRPIYAEMSVRDNLVIGGFSARRADADRAEAEVFELFPELARRRDVKAGALSGGQAQMLAVAQALMSAPKVVLLDEPSVGLAVAVLHRLGEIVEALAQRGVAVLWVEQFPDVVLRHCDSVVLMVGGHCRPKQAVSDIEPSTIEQAYFGAGY